MNKKIAISIWRHRISPVMDTSSRILVLDYENNLEIGRTFFDITHLNGWLKGEFLKKQGVDLLICGAISMQLHQYLTSSNIEVIPFIRGPIRRVLDAYAGGVLHDGDFYLPGCRNNFSGRGCNRRRGRRRFNNK